MRSCTLEIPSQNTLSRDALSSPLQILIFLYSLYPQVDVTWFLIPFYMRFVAQELGIQFMDISLRANHRLQKGGALSVKK